MEPVDRGQPDVNVVKREFQNIKDYELNYFGWALDRKAVEIKNFCLRTFLFRHVLIH